MQLWKHLWNAPCKDQNQNLNFFWLNIQMINEKHWFIRSFNFTIYMVSWPVLERTKLQIGNRSKKHSRCNPRESMIPIPKCKRDKKAIQFSVRVQQAIEHFRAILLKLIWPFVDLLWSCILVMCDEKSLGEEGWRQDISIYFLKIKTYCQEIVEKP